MAEIAIQDEHNTQLSRAQYVLEWLLSERASAEAAYLQAQAKLQQILEMGQRAQDELAAFLALHYGMDPAKGWTLDVERGTITTPDPDPAPVAAPVVD